jgi:serine/threonine protein kinase
LEFVAGKTLRSFLPPGGLSGSQAWKFLEPIFQGLQYVHDRGVVHRDLKPENIMVTPEYRVVLMDFGLARRKDFSMLTASGGILGTPAYMAPEQIMGLATDGRCDQYATGILVYEMLTGGSPFPDVTDPIHLMMKHIHEEPQPARKLRPDISPELELVLLKMLSRKPEDRFTSMGECACALGPLLLELGAPG